MGKTIFSGAIVGILFIGLGRPGQEPLPAVFIIILHQNIFFGISTTAWILWWWGQPKGFRRRLKPRLILRTDGAAGSRALSKRDASLFFLRLVYGQRDCDIQLWMLT